MKMPKDLERRLARSKVNLILDNPFFGSLATRLENLAQIENTPTCKTNGKVIKWNPEFVQKLTDKELVGVYAHEILHVANGHAWRRGGRSLSQWNVATDKAINYLILASGLSLPPNALRATAEEEGKSAEEIYHISQENEGEEPTKPSCGEVEDCPPDEQAEQAAEWKIAVTQAAACAKAMGKLPGELARFVQEMLNPCVPWETILRDFVERTARNDYNWTRPNRRHLQRGIILPSLVSDELPEIVIAVDTSGSIGEKELAQFSVEASDVLGAYETTINIIYCDAAIAGEEVLTRADLPLKLKALGGGGTDFRPAMAWVEKKGLSPACFIYLTDGYGQFPDIRPDYPVLWVMNSDVKAPWGETVSMLPGKGM